MENLLKSNAFSPSQGWKTFAIQARRRRLLRRRRIIILNDSTE